MNRFGKLLLTLLVLAGVGFATMVRFGGSVTTVSLPPPAPPHVAERAGPLLIPVAGVRADALVDTFRDARGTGRVHDAIDIMAPRGTPVIAAGGGTIEKLFDSDLGGHTLYVRSTDQRWVDYYAHLDGYAAGVREGMYVPAGTAIATVGSTGDASPEGPHLHFEVKRMAAGEAWHQGTAIDPYPLLGGR